MNQELNNQQRIQVMNNQIYQLQSILAQKHVDLSDPNLFNDNYDLEPTAVDEGQADYENVVYDTQIENSFESKSFSEETDVDLGNMF